MRNRGYFGLVPLTMIASALMLGGCDDEVGADQALLDTNRAKWQAANIDSYVFQRWRSCACPLEEPMVVTVTNGVVTNAFFTPSGVMVEAQRMATLRTIDGFFEWIQGAIDQDANRLVVSYDETYGFPNDIYIDFEQLVADDEIGFTLTEFQ